MAANSSTGQAQVAGDPYLCTCSVQYEDGEASVREERDEMQVHEEEILMVARVRGGAMAASGN
jgi:hypothetical protein